MSQIPIQVVYGTLSITMMIMIGKHIQKHVLDKF